MRLLLASPSRIPCGKPAAEGERALALGYGAALADHLSYWEQFWNKSVQTLCDYGSDYWVGFSFCWLADLYGRLGDGEKAALRLRQFTDCLCSQNGFHLNGDFKAVGLTKYRYRPFTLESNMMLAEALQEMLLQCHDGVIRIFPAVPGEWLSDCAFDGLLAYGNIKVSARAENGRTVRVTLHARRDAAVRILNPFTGEIDSFPLRRGETRVLTEKDR